ncbi:PAS domain S-box [Desulfocurvibacter africanus PCS]|uniref:histidine kinase n=1 Tax=Desulfocurvibacter africanus PCS TaxID=1262666 RepID=M5PTE4_DESAF|nr:response regulator [Desulfocurvibacter africanus]EMG37315.1 PAS domain S-box [Desulfocurvibacter africanus PCS]
MERLLIIDDEEGIRRMLGLSLSDMGYEVHAAADGAEGLDFFDRLSPDIVLLDIKMPGMNGLEVLRRIKSGSTRGNAEVIMISGHGDLDLAIGSLQLDAVDFVTKPIRDEMLHIALKRAHDKLAMRRELRTHTENLERLVQEKSARVVELERQIAVGRAVESLTEAMSSLTGDIGGGGPGPFSEIPCFVSVHNRYLEIVATNRLYRERLGDKVGQNSWEAYSGRQGRGNGCPVWQTIETGHGQRSSEIMVSKDGQEIPVIVHTAPILGPGGKVEFVLEFSVDVTEVKRLQDELRTAQQKYQEIFDASPAYISVHGLDFRIREANRMFRECFDADVGERCFEAYKHRDRPCSECVVQRTVQEGRTVESETVVTDREGRPINVLIRTSPIRNEKGHIVEVMEMATDITQLRQLQDHLSNLGLMIGSMSHGVKGLLTALDGGVYKVERGLAGKDEIKVAEGWAVVTSMVGRIKKLVLDILYYAKTRYLNHESMEVAAFAKSLAEIASPKAERQGVSFCLDISGSLGAFEIDEVALSSAMVNFLENAVDACVADQFKPAHVVTLRTRADGDMVYFEVVDNGIGMDRETREKMFTLFFSSKGSKGTGIGTYISGQVVSEHGGRVRVESVLSQGTTVHVAVPRFKADIRGLERMEREIAKEACQ